MNILNKKLVELNALCDEALVEFSDEKKSLVKKMDDFESSHPKTRNAALLAAGAYQGHIATKHWKTIKEDAAYAADKIKNGFKSGHTKVKAHLPDLSKVHFRK
jgi:catechol-2,3-dioxygenase